MILESLTFYVSVAQVQVNTHDVLININDCSLTHGLPYTNTALLKVTKDRNINCLFAIHIPLDFLWDLVVLIPHMI